MRLLSVTALRLAISAFELVSAAANQSYYGRYPCQPNLSDHLDTTPCALTGPPGSLCVPTIPSFYGGHYCGTQGAACVQDYNCDNGSCYVAGGQTVGSCTGGLGFPCYNFANESPSCLGTLSCGSDGNCGGQGANCSALALIVGQTTANWQCDSTYCNPSNTCGTASFPSYPCTLAGYADQTLCRDQLPTSTCIELGHSDTFWCGIEGAKCSQDSDCDHGFCDITSNTCKGSLGEACSTTPCLGHLGCGDAPDETCGGLHAKCTLDNIIPSYYLCDQLRYYCDAVTLRCSAPTYGHNPCNGLDGKADQAACDSGDFLGSTCTLEATTQTFWCGLDGAACKNGSACDRGNCQNGLCVGGLGASCLTYADCLGALDCSSKEGITQGTCGGVGAACISGDYTILVLFASTVPLDFLCTPDARCGSNSTCVLRTTSVTGGTAIISNQSSGANPTTTAGTSSSTGPTLPTISLAASSVRGTSLGYSGPISAYAAMLIVSWMMFV